MKGAIIGFVVLLLIAGGVGGAAFMGLIDIPGITPAKKKPVATSTDKKLETKKTVATPKPTNEGAKPVAKKAEPKPIFKPELGAEKVATYWNEVETAKLVEITKDWKESDLVPVLLKMDEAKVTEYLATIDVRQASKLSKALQKAASEVKVAAESS